MEVLNRYFILFDESRTSEEARKELNSLFTRDMSFVLAGHKKDGIEEWEKFLDSIFENNVDIKHMHEEWTFNENTKKFEARWAVCGKSKAGKVYTQVGVDIAQLDENGKIKYLENVPDNAQLFKKYE